MDKYNASIAMEKIISAIQDTQKLGLAVCIKDNKIIVVNTVQYELDQHFSLNPKIDSFAYAEYEGFSDYL